MAKTFEAVQNEKKHNKKDATKIAKKDVGNAKIAANARVAKNATPPTSTPPTPATAASSKDEDDRKTGRNDVLGTRDSVVILDNKTRRREEAAIRQGQRRASLVGMVGGFLYGGNGQATFLECYQHIRPLVIRLTAMSTSSAYRSFKLIGSLQRVCNDPFRLAVYAEEAANALGLPPSKPVNTTSKPVANGVPKSALAQAVLGKGSLERSLLSKFHRMIRLAAVSYPAVNLMKNGVKLALKESDTLVTLVKRALAQSGGKGDVCKERSCKCFAILRHKPLPLPCSPSFTLIQDFEHREFIVLIQGSTNTSDFVTNLLCDPSSNEEGLHEGMRRSAEFLDAELREDLLVALAKAGAAYHVVLTGHSLGAGVASLVAKKWIDELPAEHHSRITCIGFATPCIVPPESAAKYRQNIHTIVFGRDVVPRLSFGSVRDLLVMMQGLAAHLAAGKKGVDQSVSIEDIIKEDVNKGAKPIRSVDTPSTPSEAGDTAAAQEDESECRRLPQRRGTLTSTDFGKIIVDIDNGLTDSSKKEQLRALAQSISEAKVNLPLTFNQLSTLANRAVAVVDERLKEFKVVTTLPPKPSLSRRLLWKLIKCCSGGCRSTTQELKRKQALTAAQTRKIADYCLADIHELRDQINCRQLVPPGSLYLIATKLHFMECEVKTTIPFNRGQAIIFAVSPDEHIRICQEPAWNFHALKEHGIDHYLQALAPESLWHYPHACKQTSI